jgi:aspartate aminotransferase
LLTGIDGGFRTSLEFADGLLADERVAVTPGEAFDAPGFIRVSYATSMENLREGSERIVRFARAHSVQPAAAR